MPQTINRVSIIPVPNLPLVTRDDDLTALIINGLSNSREKLEDNDILVISQKIVSKAEGNIVYLDDVTPSREAQKLAGEVGKDPRIVHLILKESKRVVRKSRGVLITEHKKSFSR